MSWRTRPKTKEWREAHGILPPPLMLPPLPVGWTREQAVREAKEERSRDLKRERKDDD